MFTLPVPQPITSYLLIGLLVLALPVMWVARLSIAQAGWRFGGWAVGVLGVGWGVLLGAGLVAWLRYLLHTGNYLPVPVSATAVDWALLVVAGPIVEELALRGVLLGSLQRAWSPFWALSLTAGADVLIHANQPWLAVQFVAALGYGLAFRQGRSVAAPVLAHALAVTALLLARLHPWAVRAVSPRWLLIGAGAGVVLILIGALGRRGHD